MPRDALPDPLQEHHTKSIAERSYSLLRGREVTIQMSLPGDIPATVLQESVRACLVFQSISILVSIYWISILWYINTGIDILKDSDFVFGRLIEVKGILTLQGRSLLISGVICVMNTSCGRLGPWSYTHILDFEYLYPPLE